MISMPRISWVMPGSPLASSRRQQKRFAAYSPEPARDLNEPTFEAWGQNGQGDVLVAQGDGPAALRAYQEGLAIAEALAKREPANTAWQVDVAVSCSKMGSLGCLLPARNRKQYLLAGQQILLRLKEEGRLHANQDWTGWFDQALNSLE